MLMEMMVPGIVGYFTLVLLLQRISSNKLYHIFSQLCALVWVCTILYFTLLVRCPVLETRIHLVPFRDAQFNDLVVNAVLFLPFGSILSGLLSRIKIRTCIAAGVLTSVLIELAQLLSHRGICDIDDLIANSIGVVLGEIFFVVIRRCTHPAIRTP